HHLALALGDLGVDELQDPFAGRLVLGVDVEHDDALADTHLRGGQADAGRSVHRLGQVVDQRYHLAADVGDRGRPLLEQRIRIFEYLAERHAEAAGERIYNMLYGSTSITRRTGARGAHGARVLGTEGLHHHTPRGVATAGAARHLHEELERALGGAEVGHVERQVGEQDGDQGHAGYVVPLAHHLRADQDVGGARAPVAQDAALGAGPLRGVAVEAVDDRQRVARAQRGLDLLRPHPERLEGAGAAPRAGGGWPARVAAVVADERPGR